MDTKSMLTFLVVAAFTILLLTFRNKISQKFNQYSQKLSGWLPRGFMRWLSAWRPYFKSRTRQLFSRLWDVLEKYAVLILILSATFSAWALFYSHGKLMPLEAFGALEALNMIISLMALGSAVFIFGLIFVLLFILSLYPKGRRIADKHFQFTDLTELEALKARVGKIEVELPLINKRLGNIENRLGNIETAINSLAKSTNHAKHRPTQKSERSKAKRTLK